MAACLALDGATSATERPLVRFASRARGVRWTGEDRLAFSCDGPLHRNKDRHRSGSARELADGRLLLHCFVGCSIQQILGPLGLELHDLYPHRESALIRERAGLPRHRLDAATGLRLIAAEADRAALLIAVAARHELTAERRQRLMQAARSISLMLRACGLRGPNGRRA
jgi:hypothetical protein